MKDKEKRHWEILQFKCVERERHQINPLLFLCSESEQGKGRQSILETVDIDLQRLTSETCRINKRLRCVPFLRC